MSRIRSDDRIQGSGERGQKVRKEATSSVQPGKKHQRIIRHGSLIKYSPQASNTDNRLVIPSNSLTCLLRLMSRSSQLARLADTYRPTRAPSPELSMCVRSVRSMTIRFERGISSLTSFLRMAATSAVNLPLHSTTVASSFAQTCSLKRGGGASVGFIRIKNCITELERRKGPLKTQGLLTGETAAYYTSGI